MELSAYFGAETFFWESSLPRFVKHPFFILKTVFLLANRRPRVLIVQNPSVILAFVACLCQGLFGYFLVVDAHNVGLIPDSAIGKKVGWFYKYLIEKANLTIVTNEYLARHVKKSGGFPYILPDKLPSIIVPAYGETGRGNKHVFNVLFVCSYGLDEPYDEVFEAALSLPDNFQLSVTGDYKKLPDKTYQRYKEKLNFLGYVSDAEYCSLLCEADLVMVLTVRENCLVCGAYEAVAVETPMLLSETKAIKEYFYKGAVFTKNKAENIASAIIYAEAHYEQLKNDVVELKDEISCKWVARGEELFELLVGVAKL